MQTGDGRPLGGRVHELDVNGMQLLQHHCLTLSSDCDLMGDPCSLLCDRQSFVSVAYCMVRCCGFEGACWALQSH